MLAIHFPYLPSPHLNKTHPIFIFIIQPDYVVFKNKRFSNAYGMIG